MVANFTLLLLSFPGPLKPGVEVPDRVLSMGKIELNSVLMYCLKLLATLVEGNKTDPFSIATKPRYRGGRYSFPWIGPLYPWSVPYIAKG